MSVMDLIDDMVRDAVELAREHANTGLIEEFANEADARAFVFKHGRLDYTICAGINEMWAVRRKSEGEKERDAYWREFR
jgi:hypothetical protein